MGGGGALRPASPRLGGMAVCRPLLRLGVGGAGLLHSRSLLGGWVVPICPPPPWAAVVRQGMLDLVLVWVDLAFLALSRP
jgi:hypothetical protein